MSNKKTGSSFEEELAQILAQNGYWAKVIPDNENGQPFDVIAARQNRAYAFECKTCNRKMFDINRIETNQRSALKFFMDKGNENCFFVFKYKDNIYYNNAKEILKSEGSIDVSKLIPLRWLL